MFQVSPHLNALLSTYTLFPVQQIVPAEVTVGLLRDAMQKSGKLKVLIDGFPRNDSNREVFHKVGDRCYHSCAALAWPERRLAFFITTC